MTDQEAVDAVQSLTMAVFEFVTIKHGEMILDAEGQRVDDKSAATMREIKSNAERTFTENAYRILTVLLNRPPTPTELQAVMLAID